MPEEQQTGGYVSTDPNAGIAVSQEMLDAALVKYAERQKKEKEEAGRQTFGSVARNIGSIGLGAAKGTGRTVLDMGRLAEFLNPMTGPAMAAGMMPSAIPAEPEAITEALTPRGGHQEFGSIASTFLPGGVAARGGRASTAAARFLQNRAVPGMSEAGIGRVLEKGIGYPSHGNLAAFTKEAAPIPTSRFIPNLNRHATRANPLAKDIPAFQAAADKPARNMSMIEAMGLASMPLLGAKNPVALLGAGQFMTRPGSMANTARVLNRVGPLAEMGAGGTASAGIEALLDALMRGEMQGQVSGVNK